MATTKGLVQRIKTGTGGTTWVYLGPAPNNTQLLFVPFPANLTAAELAARSSMVDALTTAMMVHREVTVTTADGGSQVSQVDIQPV